MSSHPICVNENATINEIVKEMDIYQISQVLVVRGKAVIGIVGRLQLLTALESCLRGPAHHQK